MSLGLIFWILMLLWLLGSAYTRWPLANPRAYGVDLLLFILLLILGWGVFGAPIKG
jgi:hypothetical protein